MSQEPTEEHRQDLLKRFESLMIIQDSDFSMSLVELYKEDWPVISEMARLASIHSHRALPHILSYIKKGDQKNKLLNKLLYASCEKWNAFSFRTISENTSKEGLIQMLSSPYRDGHSPISMSTLSGCIMQVLGKLDKKHHPTILLSPFNVKSPLMVAVERGNLPLAEELICLCPESINKEYNGRTCLDIALDNRNILMIDLLVSNGSDRNRYLKTMSQKSIYLFSLEDLYLHAALMGPFQFPNLIRKEGRIISDWCTLCIIYQMAKICSDKLVLSSDHECDLINYGSQLNVRAYIPLLTKINPHFVSESILNKELINKIAGLSSDICSCMQNVIDHLIYHDTNRFKLFCELFRTSIAASSEGHRGKAQISSSILTLFLLHTSSPNTKHIEDYCMMAIVRNIQHSDVVGALVLMSLCEKYRGGVTPLLLHPMAFCIDFIISSHEKNEAEYSIIREDEQFPFIAHVCLSQPRSRDHYIFGSATNHHGLSELYGSGEEVIEVRNIKYAYHRRILQAQTPILLDMIGKVPDESLLPFIKNAYGISLKGHLIGLDGSRTTLMFILGSKITCDFSKSSICIGHVGTRQEITNEAIILCQNYNDSVNSPVECYLYDLIIDALSCGAYSMIEQALLIIKENIGPIIRNRSILCHSAIFMRLLLGNSYRLVDTISADSFNVIVTILNEELDLQSSPEKMDQ